MTFLDLLRQRYASVVDEPKPPSATDAVPHDHFDAATWTDVRRDVRAIDQAIVELSAKHDYVDDFARDTFNLLVKGDPQVRNGIDMAPTHVPNRTMVDGFAKAPEVQQLRTLTANDPYGAAMAYVSMQQQITDAAEAMQSARAEAAEAEQRRQEAEQTAQEALEALRQAQEAEAGVQRDDDVEAAWDAAQQAEQAQQALEQAVGCGLGAVQAREQVEQASQEALAAQRAAIRQAAEQATQERDEESQLLAAFGVEDGDLKRMDFRERAALAARLRNNRMAQFAHLIGQFKQMAAAQQRRRVKHVADEIVGVTLGDDLQRLTMGELVNLSVPELEDDFWLRYVNRELVVYDLAGTERMGQGPIIVVNDESGSMQHGNLPNGTPEAWSKALALALLDQARRQGRDFHYIGFSSAGQQWVTSFPAGRGPVTDVITLCEHFFSGGTAYEQPLSMALDLVEQAYADRNLPKPDIVFVTDEQYGALSEPFMQRWHATKARLSLRCFGVGMGLAEGQNGALQAVADDVRTITSLTADPQHVADVFRML